MGTVPYALHTHHTAIRWVTKDARNAATNNLLNAVTLHVWEDITARKTALQLYLEFVCDLRSPWSLEVHDNVLLMLSAI